MKKQGIKLGNVVHVGFQPYIIARAGRHKVTLFSPETGAKTITRREYFSKQKRIFMIDEAWLFMADPKQRDEYNEQLQAASLQAKNAFDSFISRKGWKDIKDFTGYAYAMWIVPQPGPNQAFKDAINKSMRRSRKYNAEAFMVDQDLGKLDAK